MVKKSKPAKPDVSKTFAMDWLKPHYARLKQWLWHNRFGRAVLLTIIGGVGLSVLMVGWYFIKHRNEPVQIGVSFSQKYADELGVDWQANFAYLLDELEFRYFRLMSYWDTHEPTNNQFDFSALDWQMNEAAKRGAKVSLAIGERQPRWPECHHPEWVKSLDQAEFENELLNYLEVVVKRYRHHPALEKYQLENEIYNNFFGECEAIKRQRLQDEFDLVKKLDKTHPVSINVASQEGFPPLREPIGDVIGFSVYRVAAGSILGLNYYWRSWYFTPHWHALRAAFVEIVHGSQAFIHELQTEPWGPRPTAKLSVKEQEESMDPEQIRQNVEFGVATGIKRMYLWGGEWWYWRETKFDDGSLTNTVQQVLSVYSKPARR